MISTLPLLLCVAGASSDCQNSDAGATDSESFACAGGYTDLPQYCGGYDDTDFTSNIMCCECRSHASEGGGAAADCEDGDEGATDTLGLGCAAGYIDTPNSCGVYDDSDFTASVMCCTCAAAALVCQDSDSQVVDIFAGEGLTIDGCVDLGSFCGDPEAGQVLQALCCATCSGGSPDVCEDTDAGASDADNYSCAAGYFGAPQFCGQYDDTDFSSDVMCCECQGGVASPDCQDSDAGALDSANYTCGGGYTGFPQHCGGFDDGDFTSSIMCCACIDDPAPAPGPPGCADTPGWDDGDTASESGPYDCDAYVEKLWCTSSGGHGVMWNDDWGSVADYVNMGQNAFEACCGCGSGADSSGPPPPPCVDAPEGWHDGDYTSDSGPFGCDVYAVQRWCTASGGNGDGWDVGWGNVADYTNMNHNALEACCACGGGAVAGCVDTDAGALDSAGYACEGGYTGLPQYCGGFDDSDFTSSIMCCECEGVVISPSPSPSGISPSPSSEGECEDSDAGALDSSNYACEGGYTGLPQFCGGYDDSDFTSVLMCCECEGITTTQSTTTTTSATSQTAVTTVSATLTATVTSTVTITVTITATTGVTTTATTTVATAVTTTGAALSGPTNSGTTPSATQTTRTRQVEYVVSQSITFASSGSREMVSNAVALMVTLQFGVSSSQVTVAVSNSSGEGARRLQATQWQVDYEITMDSDGLAADSILEAAAASSTNSSAMIQSLDAALQDEGATLDTNSVIVQPPVIATNTMTVTSRTTTATISTMTETSATSTMITGTSSGTTLTLTSMTLSSTTVSTATVSSATVSMTTDNTATVSSTTISITKVSTTKVSSTTVSITTASTTSVTGTTLSTLSTTSVSTGTDTVTTTSVTTTSGTFMSAATSTRNSGTTPATTSEIRTTGTTVSTTVITTALANTRTETSVTMTATDGLAGAVASAAVASPGEGEAGEASGMAAIVGGVAGVLVLLAVVAGAVLIRRSRGPSLNDKRAGNASGGTIPEASGERSEAPQVTV